MQHVDNNNISVRHDYSYAVERITICVTDCSEVFIVVFLSIHHST